MRSGRCAPNSCAGSRALSRRTGYKVPEDLVDARDAVGERRGPRLQDVGRLDLEEHLFPYGRNLAPAFAGGDTLGPEFLAAPGSEHDLRVAPDHFRRVGDDAAGRRLRMRALREHILAAGDFDQLAHPADAADHWLVPFLEVDPRPP